MTLQILRADEHPVVPWANGRGVTEVVVSWPPGDDDFDWRVSIATVEEPGAFSSYAGIDRTLVVAAGGPLVLGIDGTVVAAERFEVIGFGWIGSVAILLQMQTIEEQFFIACDLGRRPGGNRWGRDGGLFVRRRGKLNNDPFVDFVEKTRFFSDP